MYEIKEIILKNKDHEKKRFVITFKERKMAIVGEFLMIDAPLMNGKVVDTIESVLHNQVEQTTFTGQRCHLQISKTEILIEDLYTDIDGMEPLDSYTINTHTLLELVNMWLNRLAVLNE